MAAQKEANVAKQALRLTPEQNQIPSHSNLSFGSLLEAQTSVKQILSSNFSLQDMEDLKEQEIANIKSVLESPELATLLSTGQPTNETISTITQIIETVTTPSLYIVDSICRYGDDSSIDWRYFVADWVERLSTRKFESGHEWASAIKFYPGLLLLYAAGISSLRSTNIYFIKEVAERSVYNSSYDTEDNLLEQLDQRAVFREDVGQLIEASPNPAFTPVSNYLTKLIHDKLYPKIEDSVHTQWFDLFEFLLSLKSVQMGNHYPYEGSFIWRSDGRRKLIQVFQDSVLGRGRYGIAVQNFFGDSHTLVELASAYDKIALEYKYPFGRASLPSYLGILVEATKSGQRICTQTELNQLIHAKR